MEANYVGMAVWILTLIAAAITDVRSFRIPNLFPGIVILLFIVVHGLAGFSTSLWENLLHFLAALAVGMILFARGWIGGGDAKLYAAVALWFSWAGAISLIFATTMAGGVVAIAFIGARLLGLRKNVPKEDRRIPYGVAIAAGAILSAAWRGWGAIFPPFS
jgi:prepilin peptidase CpaA